MSSATYSKLDAHSGGLDRADIQDFALNDLGSDGDTGANDSFFDIDNEEEDENSSVDFEVDDFLEHKESWDFPAANKWRVLATFFGFLVFGANDASIGVLVSHLEEYYNVNDAWIALCFLSPFSGYILAAMLSSYSHEKLGYQGVAIVAALCQFTTFFISSFAPPFPVYVVGLAISGFGCGTIEASWNTFIGNLQNSDAILGILHGCYGLGAMISPTVATSLFKLGYSWTAIYKFLMVFSVLELVMSSIAFRGMNAAKFRSEQESHAAATKGDSKGEGGLTEALKTPIVWLLAAVLLVYVGAEVTTGGWIVTFMIRIRGGSKEKMGLVATGFWGGLTSGRFILGFVTNHFGNTHKLTTFYISCAIFFQLLFWLVPSIAVSSISAILVGFFIGPIFPSAMSLSAEYLPKRIQIAGIGLASAIGGGGAALIPFITGLFINHLGARVMPPTVFVLFIVMIIGWVVLPRLVR